MAVDRVGRGSAGPRLLEGGGFPEQLQFGLERHTVVGVGFDVLVVKVREDGVDDFVEGCERSGRASEANVRRDGWVDTGIEDDGYVVVVLSVALLPPL